MEIGEGVPRLADEPPGDDGLVRIKIRVSLFFDGTRNNRRNARVREKVALIDRGAFDRAQDPAPDVSETRARQLLHEYGSGDVSFANDVTNVVRLDENVGLSAPGYDFYLHVYTEGIATTDLAGDSTVDAAVAMGATGTVVKVETGIANVVAAICAIRDIDVGDTVIEQLTVDTCGFSRGAAAARYCIHRVLDDGPAGAEPGRGTSVSLKTQLLARGWRGVGRVEVRAVGLFDTVSSHGVVADAGRLLTDPALVGRFDDNTAVLHLDAVRRAAAVYQLAAAEEYRANFSLTNIDSAGGRGRQVYLPGAHSDVGGGYLDGAPERQTLVLDTPCSSVAQFMRDRGWYRTSELTFTILPFRAVHAERRSVAHAYTFVPLNLMANFLRQQGVPVRPDLEVVYDPKRVPGYPEIMQHAAAVGVPPISGGRTDGISVMSRPQTWEDNRSAHMKNLRHDFLHVSFRANDTGMGVRLIETARWPLVRYRPVRRVLHG